MQSISAWVMSIAGIVCLSVLVELIMPSGQMNKYIKGIFSFIVLFVIISPIPTLLGKKINIDNVFDSSSTLQVQDNYLYQLNLDKVSAMQNEINAQIQDLGYSNVQARIDCDIFSSSIVIRAIYVDLPHLIITENARHTDILEIKKDIVLLASSAANIKEERVVFNE